MNYGGVVLIGVGGVALIFGIRGTYKSAWQSITGAKKSTASAASTSTINPLTRNTYGASSYQSFAYNDATAAGINPDYFVKQIQAESGFNPNSESPAGALGIAQFMPATAAALGINPLDPQQSLKGAAGLMKSLMNQFGGSEAKALAAYNAGPSTVSTAVANYGSNWWQDIPGETQQYIQEITGSYNV